MITEMKVGRYYRIPGGLEKRPYHFNDLGYMDFMLDGNWHKCIDKEIDYDHVRFKFDHPPNLIFLGLWNWSYIYDILEEKKEIKDGQYLLDI